MKSLVALTCANGRRRRARATPALARVALRWRTFADTSEAFEGATGAEIWVGADERGPIRFPGKAVSTFDRPLPVQNRGQQGNAVPAVLACWWCWAEIP